MTRALFQRVTLAVVAFGITFSLAGGAFAVPVMTSGDVAGDYGKGTFAPSGWTSVLYPRDWTPGFTDPDGRAPADFSYAGYARGERLLPTMEGSLTVDVSAPPFNAPSDGVADATDEIQSALDYVGQSGGGVVYLPRGTYRVSRRWDAPAALLIRYDNVVLRGAGRGLTRIYNVSRGMRAASVISAVPTEAGSWAAPAAESLANLAADTFAGSREVRVSNPLQFEVGQLVVVRTEASEQWLADRGNPRNWTANTFDATTYLRRIEQIEADGTLVVDIPFRTDLLVRDQGQLANVFPARRHLSGVGVEDLSIGMRPHPADKDLLRDTHEASAIKFRNVMDSWIQRVNTYKPVSTSPYNILSEGIWLESCRNVTVADCIMSLPQNRDAGNGNGYVIRGSDNLIESCAAIQARHSYTFGYVHATGNVVRECVSARPTLNTDFHMWFSAANLVEDMFFDGDAVDASFRSDGANLIHGYTTSQSLIWNIRGVRQRVSRPTAPLVNSIQWGWGAVVGTQGTPSRVSFEPEIDGVYGDRTVDLVEGVADGATLVPQSVYSDQLRRRLSGMASDILATGTVLAPLTETSVTQGSLNATAPVSPAIELGAGDRELYTFDLQDVPRVERARLVFSGRPGKSFSTVAFKVLASPSPRAQATLIKTVTQTRNRPSVWVVDLSDTVRWRSATGAKTITLEVSHAGGTPLLLHTNRDESPSRRPRLEVETAPSAEMTASVVIGARKSVTAADASMTTGYSTFSRPTVTLDLGSVRRVDGVGVAFGGGNKHFDFADVWVSADGVAWRPAGAVCGTGCTVAFELEKFAAPVQARFVRLIGLGTSRATSPGTVSFREIEVYGD